MLANGFGNGGNFYSETYCTSVTYGPDGKKVEVTKAEKKVGRKDEKGN
jgi:hypothetical protein